ncbi:MAG: pyridoxal phosphate-dependent aminotransferase [Propionibacteriaceae bacterium]|nr:pyridoxal phosphate-dependent aminotransferase [Propionibacteriaceae bacterium]
MRPLRLSSRVAFEPPNDLAAARQAAQARGDAIWDLTDSNPTRHGLMDPAVMEVLAKHLDEAARYAPDPKGWLPARQALAARFGGQADDYWLTASTSEAYSWLFTVLAEPGETVGVPVPGYPLVEPLARLAGLQAVPYPSFYVHPHGWELNLDAARRVAEQVRAMVVVNPNNPTGAYVDPPAAAALGEACANAGVPLIADEVFFPFRLDGAVVHRPVADAAAGTGAVVITLDGLSKLLAAPQLKVSWLRLSGSAELTSPLADVLDTVADTFLSVNSPAACALPELLALADSSVARIRARCATNLASLQGLGDDYRVRHTEGGWTALIDVPRVLDDDELVRRLLADGLAAHPGWFYDVTSAGSIAVSLLPEPEAFADSLRRLRGSLSR